MIIRLLTKEIKDLWIRKNFEFLNTFVSTQVILQNWVFLEFQVTQAVTNLKIKHGLIAVPRDIIQTSKTGPGSVTFNYDEFDATNVDVTTTGPCKVRFFVGNVMIGG